ncbi:MAG: glutamine synthetase family protein [Paracoccaceae bacterium]
MPGNLSFENLKAAVAAGAIDTVIIAAVDMQGRLMGKRLTGEFFVNSGHAETHCCNYVLATDMEMHTVAGYASTSWAAGYGDYMMRPDMATLRHIPWLEKTALVLADVMDHHGHGAIAHSPRAVLKRQLARLNDMGMTAMMATELEFFLFDDSYEALQARGYASMQTLGKYNEDYHIFQTTKEEEVMRAIRNGLNGAGIPVEGSKGEADAGQEEINVKYAEALDTADNHALTKNGCKEIAWQKGRALTFLAKWKTDAAGSSSHIHQSLWSKEGAPLFFDSAVKGGMSKLMEHYVAGLLEHADATTYFLAPYINSYKRFAAGTFAPTKAVWSRDNRTAGYRMCGEGSKAIRIECRVGGSDLNPYLAMAAQIAAGLDGIERKLELEAPFTGDAYGADKVREVPKTLRAAAAAMNSSAMLRGAFGDDVVDHYHHAAMWEQEDFDRRVTDYEVSRGFERA